MTKTVLTIALLGLLSASANAAKAVAIKPASSMPIPKIQLMGGAPPARCLKWDYFLHPTKVVSSSAFEGGRSTRFCMDGYPTNVTQPFPRECWRAAAPNTVPTKERPEYLTVDYTRPVAATRFVHYFENARNPSAWKNVDIQSSNDGEQWTTIASFADVKPDYPQVFPIDKPALAQHYRFVVKSLTEGAPFLSTLELETYYGASVGKVDCVKPVQSEKCTMSVHVVSSDAALKGAKLSIIAPKETLNGSLSAVVPDIAKGGGSIASFNLTPLIDGPIPVIIELRAGGFLIDKRPYTIRVSPKLLFTSILAVNPLQPAGNKVTLTGTVTNNGTTLSKQVQVSWMGNTTTIGNLSFGKSATFSISAKVKPGYSVGELIAKDDGIAKTTSRQPIICKFADSVASDATKWKSTADGMNIAFESVGKQQLTGNIKLLISDKAYPLIPVAPKKLAAALPGAVFIVDLVQKNAEDNLSLQCKLVSNDPNPMTQSWLNVELRLAVDNPKVMFRPHLDWYTVEHGANTTQLGNGHNSATRMLCIQTDNATLSMVPSTDNMIWGFTKNNEMTASFQLPLAPRDALQQRIWRALDESPARFNILLPVRKGDWWDAYRYVVQDVFKFEQPKQWAMPVTEMQMHCSRYAMSYEVWSERCQTVRSFAWNDTVFFNFYGTTYALPSLYSWYLATDNAEARIKAEKVADWLMARQEQSGPLAGAWFSQYFPGDPFTNKYYSDFDKDNPLRFVGYDQALNRWIVPHSTGSAAKTLLWYWEASGKTNERVFKSAQRACDWLIATQNENGGWPYALDLSGKAVTDLTDAGQIWCTWALWKMYKFTGEDKFKSAAMRSAESFKREFMSIRRYMGYWEDVSGSSGQVARSWEGYEPAIACLVFTEMGDKKSALECAKDTVTWSWTRVTSTRQYENCYGQSTEQAFCGPSQAQSPMVGVGLEQVYENTGDTIWSDFSGAIKSINFCADPDQGYGMCATTGWFDPSVAVNGPPYDNVRPWTTAANMRGDEYGRGVWTEWQTSQFAWLGLEWLVREGNIRAPQFFKINTDTFRGTVLDDPVGRIKMPEERCDVTGIDHYDINWVGYANDYKYALLVMNHKGKTTVAIRPHEAHLDIYTRAPRIFIGNHNDYREVNVVKKGAQYMVDIPAKANAILVWDRIGK